MYKLSYLRGIILGLLMLTVSPCLLDASDGDVVTADGTARESSKNIVKFAYDLNFEMNFDNREYDMTTLSPSMTIFGARLTPSAGISVRQSDKISHKVMAGIDVMKDFGRSPVSPESIPDGADVQEVSKRQNNWELFNEILIYYQLKSRIGRTDMTMTAGIFPKSISQAEYPKSFFSDSLRFYDNNYEGLLLTFRRPKAYYEVGCDWMGMYGDFRRERFMIFSYGDARLKDWLSIGYSAYMYHFAGCRNVWGVVDNILLNPRIDFEFASMTPFQRLRIGLGWLQGAQNDRRNIGKYVFPCGAELSLELRKWNVGLLHKCFYGSNMMPYYDNADAEGCKYGNMLYFGDPFYRVGGGTSSGFYNRLEVYYEPHISDFLNLRVGATAHFHGKFSGWQQQFSLVFNLQELLERKNK